MKNNFDKAKPHSIKKFEMIKNYTDAWARKILGYEKSTGIVFIDCMSNCGFYYDEKKSKIIEGTAIKVAKTLDKLSENYPNKSIDVYFNDFEKWKIDYLKSEIQTNNLTHINFHYSVEDSSSFLKSMHPHKFLNKNILLIYDPFKATIDWKALKPFLNAWCDVIINHMVHDTTRGAKTATKEDVIKRYEKTYQMSIDSIKKLSDNRDALDERIRNIIKKIVSKNQREHFIASFPFYNRNNGLVYNLLLCTGNIEGMKLYKKVAWKNFGNRSSDKKTHGLETQLQFSIEDGSITTNTDEHCYNITDIAKYIYKKYSKKGKISLEQLYHDLDRHPIFPTDGYKSEIKKELKSLYNVSFIKENGKQILVFRRD